VIIIVRQPLRTVVIAVLVGLAAATTPLVAGAESQTQPPPMTRVTDDTGAVSVDVPADWVVTTTPDHYLGIDDQFPYDVLLPTIVASPTGEQYVDGSIVVPSLVVQAYPTVEAVDRGEFYGDYGVGCTTFDDGELAANGMTGRWGTTSGCDWAPEQARSSLWARFDDGSGSVFADYYSTTGADATWTAIVNSIAPTGAPIQTTPGFTPVFPYAEFSDVPQLGSEPVRGTGCGADGSIGDVIPDGIWSGFVDPPVPGEPLTVDLLCIFTPEAAPGVLSGGTATILIPNGATEPDTNYLVVNNNQRERIVPAAAGIELRDAVLADGRCVEGAFMPAVDHADYQAWINIQAGEATWIIWGCDYFGDSIATPSAPADTEEVLLAADCALLQSTIWEGDQFLGVEYPADGAPFTESLRQAIEVTRDFFSNEASQVQSQLAQNAFAQYFAEWDSLLQAGIYTTSNLGAVTEAGLSALAPLQNACGWAE
jgi:hypothetical protein